MSIEVLFLGTGTSHGVPMIGCDCSVCRSADPRDKRNRCSVLISHAGARILVDTPPELRLSCIANDVRSVDAVLYTHHHADHIVGLDDMRRFNCLSGSAVPCYGSVRTLCEIRQTFRYAFHTEHLGGGIPHLRLIEVGGPFEAAGLAVEPVRVLHGCTEVLGYRIGSFAYVTDVKTLPPAAVERLTGLDTLVLGVLRHRPHSTHLSVSEALDLLDVLKPRRAFFTHIAHNLGHAETEARLPDNVRLAYDGLLIGVAEPDEDRSRSTGADNLQNT